MYKEKITELLLSTNREGMDKLVEHMEEGGFFTAPCSTRSTNGKRCWSGMRTGAVIS